MKTNKLLLGIAFASALTLASCQKVGWDEIDYSANVNVGQVDLPLATINVRVSDLVGMADSTMLGTDPETGTLVIKSNFDIPQQEIECPFNPNQHGSEAQQFCDLCATNPELKAQFDTFQVAWQTAKTAVDNYGAYAPEQAEAVKQEFYNKYGVVLDLTSNSVGFDGKYLREKGLQDMQYTFDMDVTFDGINNGSGTRLDSALFDHATLNSKVWLQEGMSIPTSAVKKITIRLGNQFNRAAGNNIVLYQEGSANTFNWDQDFTALVDNFSLCMMKDKNPTATTDLNQNTTDRVEMEITIDLHIDDDDVIRLGETSPKVYYQTGVNMDGMTSIWGMFDTNSLNNMKFAQEVSIANMWEALDKHGVVRLPFNDPKININLNTKGIGGHLLANFKELYAKENDGTKSSANPLTRNLDIPLDASNIGQTTSTTIRLDNTAEGGQINKLFASGHPMGIGFDIQMGINANEIQMCRVERNIEVSGTGSIEVPFSFDKGFQFTYRDTLEDMDLSILSTDSIKAMTNDMVDIKDGELVLLLDGKNSIPEDLVVFLMGESEAGIVAWKDSAFFPAAVEGVTSEHTDSLVMTKENLDKMRDADHIIFEVCMKNDEHASEIKPEQGLKVALRASLRKVNADINLIPQK